MQHNNSIRLKQSQRGFVATTLEPNERRVRPPRIFAGLLILLGLMLLLGGAQLVALGGSVYYVLAGAALIASGVLLWRANRWGARLYALLTFATILWAVFEAGFDGWALAPRVLPFLVLGLFLLRPRVQQALSGSSRPLLRSPFTWGWIATLAAICVGVAVREPYPTLPFPASDGGMTTAGSGDWLHWGRTAAGTRYAPFDQITAQNAAQLEPAWIYRTGVGGAFKATPLQVGRTLYVCLAGNIIAALDADTGEQRWRFDPKLKDSRVGFTTTCRGVTYFKAPQPLAECNERVLTATTDARLIAIDATSGKRCSTFGDNGEVSLLAGMGEVKPGFYYVTSPPTLARGVAVLGGWVADNVETEEPSGVIRGFDALTGQLKWAWDLGRADVLAAAPAAGETYTRGTPNAWSVFSADEALGLVYIPTGNATPDYYGGHRTPEAERFASSVVALDAETGALRWSFQTTHHDIWDYDVPSQPVLVDLPGEDGAVTPALVAPTKRGELFLLDRRTGAPLAEVEERAVPQTDVPQEWTAKTQPFSVGMPSFGRDLVTEQKMWGVTPLDQMLCRIEFRKLRYEGPLTPPSFKGSIQHPGFAGGMNWGSVAIDEANGVMIVNALQIANRVQLFPRAEVTPDTRLGFGGGWQHGTPYAARTDPFLSPIFTPCQQPPYGEISAVDLKTKQVLWRRPMGTSNELGPLGLKSRLPIPMGVPYSGGAVVTKGGLVFMGGTMDRRLRAYDIRTGDIVWSDVLPNSAQATPMSYMSPQSLTQYVVITVPATEAPEEAHLAEPEANVDTKAQEAGEQKDAGGGWVIAYALRR
jgi:membrane-bound PQQ-dependent dehydrogenase (glucose/quinate/shikimate family)